ncbi:MAG TPA: phosphatidate cytidylyltransferase [Candidatus Acidoferrum sp.]|jgi:phosphatidate cytidylyltransferase
MTWKRVATAVVLIPFVVGLTLWGSTAWISAALAVVIVIALFEYFALGDAIGHRAYKFWTATCALLLVFEQWLTAIEPGYQFSSGFALHREIGRISGPLADIPVIFFLFVLGLTFLTLFNKRALVEALPAAGISSSALLLVAFPLTYAIRLHGALAHGPTLLLFALVITWAGDTVAYFVGRAIGKHPLAPHLSPKKTWEGSIAGFAGALLVGAVFTRWLDAPLAQLLGMAGAGNIAGQMGDLLESAYKRSAGVKDSGALLPGHGGILDRIDALILTFPVVWYYWIWFGLPRS